MKKEETKNSTRFNKHALYSETGFTHSQPAVIESTILFYIFASSYPQVKLLTALLCYFVFPKVHKIFSYQQYSLDALFS